MTIKVRYKSNDFPPLPRGIWWEEERQRFRIRLYSRKKVFRAPYTSVRSAGSIEAALKTALAAYETVCEEVDNHNDKYRAKPDLSTPAGLLKAIGRSATSIKVNTVPAATGTVRSTIIPLDRRFR